jgi:hypothetical protein
MADVRGRDPGQLFVVGALVVATLLVVLTLFLNSAIYSENLAARNADPGVDDAVDYRSTAIETVENSISREATRNPGNSTYASVAANHTADVNAFSNATRIYSTYRGELRATTLVDRENGTYLTQNTTAELTDSESDTSWTLVEQNSRTRNFSLFVRADTLDQDGVSNLDDDTFNVTITNNDTDTVHTVSVYDGAASDGVYVSVDGNSPAPGCTADVPGSGVLYEIDFTAGEVNGTECTLLAGIFPVGSDHTIQFSNVDQLNATARGQFGLVVDSTSTSPMAFNETRVESSYADPPRAGDPWRSNATYSSTVGLTYRSNQVFYNDTVRIAPDEPS